LHLRFSNKNIKKDVSVMVQPAVCLAVYLEITACKKSLSSLRKVT
jgi:hypothetical protein